MKASELISRSLRLINEPGKGQALDPADQSDAFDALQELLDSKAVSKIFVPGISRHFFPLQANKSIYTYGAGPSVDFRSDNFGSLVAGLGDPAPIKIEDAFSRAGSSITDNELVDEFRFETTGAAWTIDPNASVENNQYRVEAPGIATGSDVTVSVTAGATYTLRIEAIVNVGDILVEIRDNAAVLQSFLIDASGFYEIDVSWATVVLPDIRLATGTGTDDIALNFVSLLPQGTSERLTLPDRTGSDYHLRPMDQRSYNREFSKGTGGRPDRYLYTRGPDEIGEIRLDNVGPAGEILVLDVLVNRIKITELWHEIRVQPDGILWLRHKLADLLAPEYGKALSPDQRRTMDDALADLASGNRRANMLRVDRGLRQNGPHSFNINAGDR